MALSECSAAPCGGRCEAPASRLPAAAPTHPAMRLWTGGRRWLLPDLADDQTLIGASSTKSLALIPLLLDKALMTPCSLLHLL